MPLCVNAFAGFVALGFVICVQSSSAEVIGARERSSVAKEQESLKWLQQFLFALRPMITERNALQSRPLSSSRRAALPHTTRMQMEDYQSYDTMSRPPSEKQLAFAQRLSNQLGKPLPEGATEDMRSCSDFIDECLSQTPPSAKQVEFAQTISSGAGIDLPEEALQSSKAISNYISANRHLLPPNYTPNTGGVQGDYSSASDSPPTEKQILFAARLAQERKLGLTAEQLSSKTEMSSFIDSCLSGTAPAAGAMQSNNEFPSPVKETMHSPIPEGADETTDEVTASVKETNDSPTLEEVEETNKEVPAPMKEALSRIPEFQPGDSSVSDDDDIPF